MPAIQPAGYTRLREAIFAAALIQYAGLDAHEAVRKAQKEHRLKTWLTREQLDEVTKAFWDDIDRERISVYVEHTAGAGLFRVDPELFEDVPMVRRYSVSSLRYLWPKHSLYTELEDKYPSGPGQSLFDWRKRFRLVVADPELHRFLKRIRQSRKRHASRPLSTNPPGRPSKVNEVKAVIREIVEAEKWVAIEPLKKLTNLVNRSMGTTVSDSTISRTLDEIYEEARDQRYNRPRKRRVAGVAGPES